MIPRTFPFPYTSTDINANIPSVSLTSIVDNVDTSTFPPCMPLTLHVVDDDIDGNASFTTNSYSTTTFSPSSVVVVVEEEEEDDEE